jgi:hypothetical protein
MISRMAKLALYLDKLWSSSCRDVEVGYTIIVLY